MGRVLAIDLGSKRVGVASSDLTRTLASPVTVVIRGASHADDHRAIAKIVEEYEAEALIVGLPLGLNGQEGKATALIRAEVTELEVAFDIPVILHDERFTTATAHKALAEQKVNSRARRDTIDKFAAAVLLQTWLDGQSPTGTP
jgi:putative holliday junction resolvase